MSGERELRVSGQWITDWSDIGEGQISPVFLDATVFVALDPIGHLGSLLPALDNAMKEKRPVVLFAPDVDDLVAETFMVNDSRDVWHLGAFLPSGWGRSKVGMLELIAAVVDGHEAQLSRGEGRSGEYMPPSGQAEGFLIGRAARIELTHGEAKVVEGAGSSERIQAYRAETAKKLEQRPDDYIAWREPPKGTGKRFALLDAYLDGSRST
jgi:hypothetical protein